MQFGKKTEVLGWIFYVLVAQFVGATTVLFERSRSGSLGDVWEPFIWEYTSGAALLLLIPAIVWLDRTQPLRPDSWKAALLIHGAATIPFSLIHSGIMVGLRKGIYLLRGDIYDFGDVPIELVYEYRKDLLTYAFVLVAIYAYRMFRSNMSGADYLKSKAGDPADQFIVKKRGQVYRIPPDSIDWIEAAGNYVILHVGETSHPLRDTMNGISERLGESFCRVHRSSIVNLNRVLSTVSASGGDLFVRLADGTQIRCSRTAKADFEERLAALQR